MADECFRYLMPISCEIKDGASFITSATSRSGLEFADCVKNVCLRNTSKNFIGDHLTVAI